MNVVSHPWCLSRLRSTLFVVIGSSIVVDGVVRDESARLHTAAREMWATRLLLTPFLLKFCSRTNDADRLDCVWPIWRRVLVALPPGARGGEASSVGSDPPD